MPRRLKPLFKNSDDHLHRGVPAMTMRIGSFSIVSAAMLCMAASPAFARDLTVVSWGGALQDAQKTVFFQPFQAKTGLKMTDEPWDGGVGVLRAKIQGGNSNWDVVEVESEELAIGCEEGLYEKLDYTKIGGKEAYLPAAVSECGVGNIVYDFILAFDGDKLKEGPRAARIDSVEVEDAAAFSGYKTFQIEETR